MTGPKISSIAAVAVAAAALIGGGTALAAAQLTSAPNQADYTISAPSHTGVTTDVFDPNGVLSPADTERLQRDAARIHAPAAVQHLHYIVFAENDDNVNDTVENYLRDHHPDLINEDSFADGHLFVGVGLDPRQAFIFAGNDVADLLDLHDSDHLENSLDAIKPGVEDNNIPAGLFAGATHATDTGAVSAAQYNSAKNDRIGIITGSGTGAGGLAVGAVAIGGSARRKRARTIQQAREDMADINEKYAGLAGRLDSIDIRAHSLTSDFADARMRQEWDNARDHFLSIHERVQRLGGLTAESTDRQYLEQASAISDAAATTREISHAEANIDKLYNMEHGDHTTRRLELQAIRDDIVDAQSSQKDTRSGLYAALQEVRDRAESLDPAAEDFMDGFAVLLRDYRAVLEQLRAQDFSDVDESEGTALTAPGITSPDYRVGYGFANFVPFWAMSTWHSDNVAAQSSSSGGTNTSFSSGFSGAGGSSSF